jgi:ATP-binding cassette subfamily B protein
VGGIGIIVRKKTQSNESEKSVQDKAAIGSLRYLSRYLKSYRLQIVVAFIALVFTSFSLLGLGYALRYLIDEGIGKGNLELLNNSYLLLMAVILLLAFATFVRYFMVTYIGEKVVADIRTDIFSHLLTLDVSFYETNRTGELLSRLTTDTTLIQSVVGSAVSVALRNSLLLIGGLVMLCVTSIELTSYVLMIVPAVVVPIILLGKKVRRLSKQTQEKIADLNAHSEETISAMATVQAFTLEKAQMQVFGSLIDETLQTAKKRITMRSILTAIVITLVLGAVATVLWIGGVKVIDNELSIGSLSSFVFYAMIVAGATGAISEVVGELQRAAGAVERLSELKAEITKVKSPISPAILENNNIGNIAFENVCFSYPSRPDVKAMNDVSFTVKNGETVAIVGPSGSGKTTIFKLLLRYYDAKSGKITIQNHNLSAIDLHDLRSNIGLVSQEPMIFSTTAYNNIALGVEGASEDAVRAAASQAEILDFLETLPQGLNSHLGEKGIRLSGGQKQRIAIARAIIRQPNILLLDEATSALDSENERKVQLALENIMQGRTTLVIAHRLATVRGADKIILLNNGRIEAIGTHEELMQNSSLYMTLARQQFRD